VTIAGGGQRAGARGGAAGGSGAVAVALRFTGPIAALDDDARRSLFDRTTSSDERVRARTAEIIARVRREGDAALFAMAEQLDGVRLDSLEVPRARWRAALDAIEPRLRRAMDRAAENIARVHRAFLPRASETEPEPGIVVGRRPDPLGRVGVYAPGGRAAYPSSVLMGAVPARVAGVGEVVLCSPPDRETAEPPRVVLAAAALAGVERVFAVGGAGAVAAMAFGTASVPRVDRVVGPGNAYVAEAKLQVTGAVAIDAPAGPSELLVIADDTADPAVVAREMLAQAEHDPLTCAAAVTVGERTAAAIVTELARALDAQPRGAIVAESLAGRGAVVWTDSLDAAIDFANDYAPEHLLIAAAGADAVLARLRNQGTVFVGQSASNAFGDYMTGANHVLPTGGLARSYSGLSVLDFFRWTTYQRVSPDAAARLADDVSTFADAEGLGGHAMAARAWGTAANCELRTASRERPGGSSSQFAVRSSYREISLYNPDRTPSPLDLSDNTNLWGVPPAAKRALESAAPQVVARYPSLYAPALKAALASYLGVKPDMVVTGCGSDDVLDSALRAFAEPGDRVAYPDPTFPALPIFARMNALEPVAVPLTTDYDADAHRLLATGARIIYLCSPNNPTGNALSRDAVERIVEEASGVVILDEAYAEFAQRDATDLLTRSDRLVISRTMSKAFGLAGLRVGYAVGSPTLIAEVEKSRGPYKVNALAELAAVTALNEDMAWVRTHVAAAIESRARLTEALRGMGLAPLDSQANFVFIPLASAVRVAKRMRGLGVAVRPFVELPPVSPALRASAGEALRISVGPWSELRTTLEVLEKALATERERGGRG
jgi:histidinol dehydrogenase